MRKISEEKRLAKNKQIAETKNQTLERHSHMQVKTFTVKIQENKLTKQQKESLDRLFLEVKWFKNHILNWSRQSEENKIYKFDTKIKEVIKKDKDMNDVPVKLQYLSSQMKQSIQNQIVSNIKTLHTLKEKGLQKCGMLRFSKEENCVGLTQFHVSYKILSSKRISIQNLGKKGFQVNGLDQFISIPDIEYTNARLLRKATGIYFQIVCYIPKENKNVEKINKVLGIDFGCSTAFTTSEGEKVDVKIQESERLKRLQKDLSRKTKGSKNFNKTKLKIRKEYQKITNRKDDISNKLVHKFCQYETVVIQDEQLSNWKKNRHGKTVQYSVLGRVKSKLKQKSNVVVLSKTAPTTKLCTNCGEYHDELKIYDRTFKCNCGVCEDRDIHAAKNMVWMFNHKVGMERTNLKRMEMKALVDQIIFNQNN